MCCGLLEGTGDCSKLVDSFLNPVAWFWSSQLYEGYWNINLFGKPVNALTANTCFQLVLAIGCVADSILLGKRNSGKAKSRIRTTSRWIESAKERLWYPSSVIGQEWRKQLLKKWHSVDDDNSGNPFGIRYANNTSDSRADRENLP